MPESVDHLTVLQAKSEMSDALADLRPRYTSGTFAIALTELGIGECRLHGVQLQTIANFIAHCWQGHMSETLALMVVHDEIDPSKVS